MIQIPSQHPDYGKGHVAGSQRAADDLCAKNMRDAAGRKFNAVTFIALVIMGVPVIALAIAALLTH